MSAQCKTDDAYTRMGAQENAHEYTNTGKVAKVGLAHINAETCGWKHIQVLLYIVVFVFHCTSKAKIQG